MLRKDLIISKTRNLLNEFIAPLMAEADKPRRKFLRQALGAILFSGSLIVSELARWIHDDCSDVFYRVKRLLNHLISPRADLQPMVKAYRQSVAQYIQPDTPIIIDLTDLAKPRAKKMKYLAYVRDASEDKLVPGYWCVEVYAHLKNKRVLPLALDAFSVDDPAVGSQNLQISRTVTAVNETLDGKGIWIADRGFDGLNLYEMWFSLNCPFVVRQRGDRYVVTANGLRMIERELLEHLRHRRAQEGSPANVVFCKVYLPEHRQPLYLVGSWFAGAEEPLMVLTSLVVENLQQAQQIIRYYQQRWACEEASRFLKNRVGLERFYIRRYEAIQRLVILAMLAMGFLTWILLRSNLLVGGYFCFTSRFRKKAEFVYYRLLDGLQEFARLYRLRLGKIPLEPLKNG